MERFIVIDDHPIFRQGLVSLIESNPSYKVIAEAGTMDDALDALAKHDVDIALVDITLEEGNGIDLIRQMRSAYPDVPVLVVTMHDEIVYAERVLRAGARGLVMKQQPPSTVVQAIRTVLSGRVYLSEQMNARMLEAMFSEPKAEQAPLVDRLSERELEVFEYIGQGYGVAEIAEILNLSAKTVHTYRDHLKEKLQLGSASELRRFAIKWHQSGHA
ncbi:MAG: response regulator transcription factor [Spirochaetota bacterium]